MGEEIVCLVSGEVHMILEEEKGERIVELKKPGEYIVIPRGVWHTANVLKPSQMLFITAGEGTEHRER